jgi:hypothetical protein
VSRLEFHVQFDKVTLMLNVNPATLETQDWLAVNDAEWRALLDPLCRDALKQPIVSGRPPALVAARFEDALRRRWPDETISVTALQHATDVA